MTRSIRVALLAAAIALAACVTGTDSPSPTSPTLTTTTIPPTTTTTISVTEAVARFEDCLDQGGLSIEPVPFDATGRPRLDLVLSQVDFGDPSEIAILSSCSSHLADGALSLEAEPELQQQVQESLAAFTECIRSQGVTDFPDPVPVFGGTGPGFPPDEVPFDDPDLEAATAICLGRLLGDSG